MTKLQITLGIALASCIAGLASADTIYLPGTGQDVVGGLDQNYLITADTTGLYTGSLPGQAVVVTSQPSVWATLPGSKWIGPSANQSTSLGTCCAGSTTYQTQFAVTDPSTASLLFSLLVDNNVIAYLNGTQVYSEGAGNGVFVGFTTPAQVSINSGFITGTNTLDFVVGNGYGPTGLDISSAPEPVTLPLIGAGLLAIGFVRRRKPC